MSGCLCVRRAGGLAACLLLALAAGQARASWIDTTSGWNHKSGVGPFGESTSTAQFAAPTYGETFKVGKVDTQLDSFSFWVQDPKKSGPINLEAMVMQWDGKKAVGPVLYESGKVTTTPKASFQELTFKPSSLQLSPGKQYVALLTVSPFFDGGTHEARVGAVGGPTVVTKSQFVYINNGSDLSKLTSTNWHHGPSGHELAFRAHFSDPPVNQTPAPSGLVLGLLGSCGLLAWGWRGRRKRA
jgi:hypothetical protein